MYKDVMIAIDDEPARPAMLYLLRLIEQLQCKFVWAENIPAEWAVWLARELVSTDTGRDDPIYDGTLWRHGPEPTA